jgi:hypothetical protein
VRKINEKNNTRKSLRISKRGKNAGMQIKTKKIGITEAGENLF